MLPRVVHCASNRCPAMYRLCEPMGLIGLDASVKVQLLAELPQGRFDRATSVLIGKGCLWRRIEITGTWCSKPTWRRHGGKYPRAGSRWFQCAGSWVRAHYRDATQVRLESRYAWLSTHFVVSGAAGTQSHVDAEGGLGTRRVVRYLAGERGADATVNVQLLAEQPRPRFFTDASMRFTED